MASFKDCGKKSSGTVQVLDFVLLIMKLNKYDIRGKLSTLIKNDEATHRLQVTFSWKPNAKSGEEE